MKYFLRISLALLLVLSLLGCGSAPEPEGGTLSCTLEVRCDVLLEALDALPEGKAALVPESGILLEQTEVIFTEGESAFDVLRRVLREQKIHFEYVDAAAYDAVYIEGIGNLYEHDCGPLSGWMYSVNGTFPSIGCSSYVLADGDAICFRYTRDMGEDLGAERVS